MMLKERHERAIKNINLDTLSQTFEFDLIERKRMIIISSTSFTTHIKQYTYTWWGSFKEHSSLAKMIHRNPLWIYIYESKILINWVCCCPINLGTSWTQEQSQSLLFSLKLAERKRAFFSFWDERFCSLETF